MIPLSALGGGGARPQGMMPLGALSGGGGGGGGGGMISLSPLGSGAPPMQPPGAPPMMQPPGMAQPMDRPPGMGAFRPVQQDSKEAFDPLAPPVIESSAPDASDETALAEVGKSARDYLDVLQPVAVPKDTEDAKPVPKQITCLENNTDLFKMFDVDMHRFDDKAVKKQYHKMLSYVNPDKLGREPSTVDKARHTRLKQAYTVVMDDQLRGVYRQHCFGISGSGGTKAVGHENALAKALELGRDLRKMGEDRAIVLHKASETGWNVQQKDQDGRVSNQATKQGAAKFNLFGDISSEEEDHGDAMLAKERRNMTVPEILGKSPRYADIFLEKAKALLLDEKISLPAAGGAFTILEEPKAQEFLDEAPKTVQRHLRRLRSSVKQMNWAMTSLLQTKESPWRGLEAKSSLAEQGLVNLLKLIKSGIAFGKFSEVHVNDFSKIIDMVHRLYMDLFERRGQELLRAAIAAELTVVYLLPEGPSRLPDGTKVKIQDLKSRADLNGKGGTITGFDYSLQRYSVEVDKQEAKKESTPVNPDLLQMDDMDDADAEEEEDKKAELDIPKKLMLIPKNCQVNLDPAKKMIESLVKDWNAWRGRPRSVSATQDAEAVAAALGPPLESMAGYLRDAASGVATAAACPDGFDLVADECREALSQARNLASKLLGEEPKDPLPPMSLTEPPKPIVAVSVLDKEAQALREAAEMATFALKLKPQGEKKSKKDKKKKRDRSSSSSSERDKKKKR